MVGFGIFAAVDLNLLKQISNGIQNPDSGRPRQSPFGRPVGGIPLGLIGWALAAVGMLLLIVGIVLHVVSNLAAQASLPGIPATPALAGCWLMRRE